MFPPHLPPPSVSIEWHRLLERVKLIVLAAVCGVFGGLAGAAMVVGWMVPGLIGTNGWIGSRLSFAPGTRSLDSQVSRSVSDRAVVVYRRLEQVGGPGRLNAADQLGRGIVVSSDGWVALAESSSAANAVTVGAVALVGKADLFTVKNVLTDRLAGIVYLKITPADKTARANAALPVANFSGAPKVGDDLFVLSDDGWRTVTIIGQEPSGRGGDALDSAPRQRYLLSAAFDNGLAITADGRFVGFSRGHELIFVGAVGRVLPGLLGAGALRYRTLGVAGTFSEEAPLLMAGQRASGFLVARVMNLETPLVRGDVVLEINGVVATADTWWYNMESEGAAKLRVWRDGQAITLTAPILNFTVDALKTKQK